MSQSLDCASPFTGVRERLTLVSDVFLRFRIVFPSEVRFASPPKYQIVSVHRPTSVTEDGLKLP